MTPFGVDSFLASFESMIIWTQFSDSFYEANVHPHTIDYGQPQNYAKGSSSTNE